MVTPKASRPNKALGQGREVFYLAGFDDGRETVNRAVRGFRVGQFSARQSVGGADLDSQHGSKPHRDEVAGAGRANGPEHAPPFAQQVGAGNKFGKRPNRCGRQSLAELSSAPRRAGLNGALGGAVLRATTTARHRGSTAGAKLLLSGFHELNNSGLTQPSKRFLWRSGYRGCPCHSCRYLRLAGIMR